ncbi:MAG: nucleotide exchange factor GrpE [Sedimentisphaerales bacterium]|nr:nucleotide exchange factor GrpE [Sedimentisphaerales bacterium]
MSEQDINNQQQAPQAAEQPAAAQAPEDLQKQVEKLQHENKDLTDKYQRLAADYANYQKRVPRQITDSVEYEKRGIIKTLLPTLDNFGHALAGAKTAQGTEALQSVIQGIQFLYDHFFDALKAHGVEKIVSAGQPFEPGKHEALMQKCDPEKPDNIVLEELQSGFALNGQVLRPAKVVVNKLPSQPEPAEEETTDVETNDTEVQEP